MKVDILFVQALKRIKVAWEMLFQPLEMKAVYVARQTTVKEMFKFEYPDEKYCAGSNNI